MPFRESRHLLCLETVPFLGKTLERNRPQERLFFCKRKQPTQQAHAFRPRQDTSGGTFVQTVQFSQMDLQGRLVTIPHRVQTVICQPPYLRQRDWESLVRLHKSVTHGMVSALSNLADTSTDSNLVRCGQLEFASQNTTSRWRKLRGV